MTTQPTQTTIRFDKQVSENYQISRERAIDLIKQGLVKLNGITCVKPSTNVNSDCIIEAYIPPVKPSTVEANKDLKIEIVYEDQYLAVINKQAGLSVHPGGGNYSNTLVNALLHLYGGSGELSGIGGVERPGIVHRLDKDTSGLMIVAKDDKTHKFLSEQIAKREVKRTYLCIVYSVPKVREGVISTNITRNPSNRKKMHIPKDKTQGKEAITHYSVKEVLANGLLSLIECRLHTGRTHQIRVHLTSIGYPLLGDQSYGAKTQNYIESKFKTYPQLASYLTTFKRQALHSCALQFVHPANGSQVSFTSALAADMQRIINIIKN